MEYLVYIIVGLYVWEMYLENHWYTSSLYNKCLNVKNKLIEWKDIIKAKVKF
jgi:hypothetical protein|tara:strand:+ start:2687 stop:2842 length:156 start_codon:yes stop_codon:yes gene_type:complete